MKQKNSEVCVNSSPKGKTRRVRIIKTQGPRPSLKITNTPNKASFQPQHTLEPATTQRLFQHCASARLVECAHRDDNPKGGDSQADAAWSRHASGGRHKQRVPQWRAPPGTHSQHAHFRATSVSAAHIALSTPASHKQAPLSCRRGRRHKPPRRFRRTHMHRYDSRAPHRCKYASVASRRGRKQPGRWLGRCD